MCGYPSVELASNHLGRENGACSYDTLSTAGVSSGRSTKGRHDRSRAGRVEKPVVIRRGIARDPAGEPGHEPDGYSPQTTRTRRRQTTRDAHQAGLRRSKDVTINEKH